MKAKIYEYGNYITGFRFTDNFIRDYEGRGCFELEVEIPDELNPRQYDSGKIYVEYKGHEFALNDMLTVRDGEPYLSWFRIWGTGKLVKLEVYSRTEKSTAMYL